MKTKLFLLGCALGLGAASPGFAATSTGSFTATLILTTGCLVNGSTTTTGLPLGTLDFGTSTATFDTLTATLVGPSGNGIFVNCTTGQTYTVQVSGSANTAPTGTTVYGDVTTAPRYLKRATDTTRAIAYTLYGTNTYQTSIANGANLAATSTVDPTLGSNYPIYGRITGGGQSPNIPAGTYTDTVNVVVTY